MVSEKGNICYFEISKSRNFKVCIFFEKVTILKYKHRSNLRKHKLAKIFKYIISSKSHSREGKLLRTKLLGPELRYN